jgi:hypothetical protein
MIFSVTLISISGVTGTGTKRKTITAIMDEAKK